MRVLARMRFVAICDNASLTLAHAWGKQVTMRLIIIGASLSEPHINGTAMRAIYGVCMYVCMYARSVWYDAPLHRLCTLYRAACNLLC